MRVVAIEKDPTILARVRMSRTKKQRVLITEDGYKFYQQKDSTWTDGINGQIDMMFTNKDLKSGLFPKGKILILNQ